MPVLVSSISRPDAASVPLPHAVWRASQMASYQAPATSTGHRALDEELPNHGWPASTLVELLLQQSGIGEMSLLRPALSTIAQKRRIALLEPPHVPQVAAWSAWGLPAERLLWVQARRNADALWAAEQILRNGSCGALLFWQSHMRTEALRRLHLAAQGMETLFWMMRPMACTQDASPAPLRLALRPANGGIEIDILKRRGPQRDEPLYLPLEGMPFSSSTPTSSAHAHMDRRVPAATTARNGSAALV